MRLYPLGFLDYSACFTFMDNLCDGIHDQVHTLVMSPSVCHVSSLVGRGVIESQNHRIIGIGRDLCGSSSPTLLMKQGHLQQDAQDLVQAGLEYLQRRRLHNLPGQPVPVLRHLRGKKFFLMSDGTSSASVCAHCPLSCRWALLKRAWPHPSDTHPSGICFLWVSSTGTAPFTLF